MEITAKKKIILIADDDKYMHELLKKEFDPETYEVTAVNSGSKLMRLLKTIKPGLIITDIYMDGKDGFEVIANVKKVNAKTPVIVITADNKIELERKARDKDVFAYFVKPLETDIFKDTVKAAMESSEG